MAHSLSSKKRIRQNAKRAARNRWRMRTLRGALKTFNDTVAHGSVEDATKAFLECQSIIDRTAQKGVIHKNNASRRKSRMSARLKAKKTTKA
jgi:small subunit ribosomal protein S20